MKRKNFCHLDTQAFIVFSPDTEKNLPLLIDLPHSGNFYPDDFCFSCNKKTLALCEERYLDELFISPVTAIGGTVLKANFARTYVDVNRAINDIDPLLLDTPWSKSPPENGRSIYGHGLVMRLIQGQNIYANSLTHADINTRIENYYSLYHNWLNDLIDTSIQQFDVSYHLNIHSMPSSVVNAHFPHAPPDFILGDLDGRTCGLDFRNHISNTLRELGYRVGINQLYKGAEIVRRYGEPAWGRHSLQIEINRALFQNEKTGEKNKGFDKLQKDIHTLVLSVEDFIKRSL